MQLLDQNLKYNLHDSPSVTVNLLNNYIIACPALLSAIQDILLKPPKIYRWLSKLLKLLR